VRKQAPRRLISISSAFFGYLVTHGKTARASKPAVGGYSGAITRAYFRSSAPQLRRSMPRGPNAHPPLWGWAVLFDGRLDRSGRLQSAAGSFSSDLSTAFAQKMCCVRCERPPNTSRSVMKSAEAMKAQVTMNQEGESGATP
jgi:hypothetical protein